MNAKSLICLLGILAFAGLSPQANGDDIIGRPPGALSPVKKKPTTELDKYKQYVYEVVGSYWFPQISQLFSSLPVGTVRVRYTIHSNGSLGNVEVIEGKQFTKLVAISVNAIKSPAPFKPFDPALIKQIGDKYTDEFSFSTTDKPATSATPLPPPTTGPSPYSML